MSYKTVETYVEVEVDLDEWTDEELIEELRNRKSNYNGENVMTREDWQYLLDLLDKTPETWYTRRVREKVSEARFG